MICLFLYYFLQWNKIHAYTLSNKLHLQFFRTAFFLISWSSQFESYCSKNMFSPSYYCIILFGLNGVKWMYARYRLAFFKTVLQKFVCLFIVSNVSIQDWNTGQRRIFVYPFVNFASRRNLNIRNHLQTCSTCHSFNSSTRSVTWTFPMCRSVKMPYCWPVKIIFMKVNSQKKWFLRKCLSVCL